MMTRWWVPALSVLLIASGCATGDSLEPTGPRITYTQVKAAPETYRGQPITLGGKVLSAKRLKEETRIEILQLPLASSLKPAMDLSTSQGRFVATRKEFLDPATIPAGTFVTITGTVAESLLLPLDETDYMYPVVEIKSLCVWSKEEEPPRIRPYIGPGPYWGPYWSPYWRPWPYYW